MALYRIAIGTLDGNNITEHFGQARNFRIVEIDQESDEEKNLADIEVVHSENCGQGHDKKLIEAKIQALLDWKVKAVLIKQIGPSSERIVNKNGIETLVADGEIANAMIRIKKYYKRHSFSL